MANSHSHHYPGFVGRFWSRSAFKTIQKLFSNLSYLK